MPSLLQITEPPCFDPKQRLVVGIDLGTTNSLVATVVNDKPVILKNPKGKNMTPSVVHYSKQGRVVGDSAKAKMSVDPANTIVSVKRLMGRAMEDVGPLLPLPYQLVKASGMVNIKTISGNINPVEVASHILMALKCQAERYLNGTLFGAVITVPAYFDDGQRQATKDAARLAGIKVLRLLNEPTAAAVAYGLGEQAGSIIAIYDLGGGTFDISILRLNKGVFEVLATGGDSALGGDDFDRAVVKWLLGGNSDSEKLSSQQVANGLQLACQLKEQLSYTNKVAFDNGEMTQVTLNKLIDPLIARTLSVCRQTIKDAGLLLADIDQIIMVGGSTRIPQVQKQVAQFFGKKPLSHIDPDTVVALGAAVQANILAGNQRCHDLLLLDVLPLSLGIETMGGLVEKIIERNSTLPISQSQQFTTARDNQTAMVVHVVQGERELVQDCRSLARFELTNIPPMVAGAPRIKVTFEVDVDGLLNVTATEQTSGQMTKITVQSSYGLKEEAVDAMLQQSFHYAKQDIAARHLREAQLAADTLLKTMAGALTQDSDLLTDSERQVIDDKMTALLASKTKDDVDAIRDALQGLNQATQLFAQKRLTKRLKATLQGQHLDKVKEIMDH